MEARMEQMETKAMNMTRTLSASSLLQLHEQQAASPSVYPTRADNERMAAAHRQLHALRYVDRQAVEQAALPLGSTRPASAAAPSRGAPVKAAEKAAGASALAPALYGMSRSESAMFVKNAQLSRTSLSRDESRRSLQIYQRPVPRRPRTPPQEHQSIKALMFPTQLADGPYRSQAPLPHEESYKEFVLHRDSLVSLRRAKTAATLAPPPPLRKRAPKMEERSLAQAFDMKANMSEVQVATAAAHLAPPAAAPPPPAKPFDRSALKNNSAMVRSAVEGLNSRFSNMMKAFQYVDLDRSGTLNKKELARALDLWNIPIDNAKLDELIAACDDDGNGEVNYKEFVDALARDTVAPAAMGKRDMQAKEAMGQDDVEVLSEHIKRRPKKNERFSLNAEVL
jgi:ribosomal protein L12E/L44/L45/RPP1/RPP2